MIEDTMAQERLKYEAELVTKLHSLLVQNNCSPSCLAKEQLEEIKGLTNLLAACEAIGKAFMRMHELIRQETSKTIFQPLQKPAVTPGEKLRHCSRNYENKSE